MTNQPYNNNVPFSTNDPSDDQPDMLKNTQSIEKVLLIDHYGFGDAQGGYHKIIHQPPTTDPAPIVGIGQTYTKTVLGDQQLFFESGNGVITSLSNGTRNVLSGTITVKLAAQTVLTLPNSVMGFITFSDTNIATPAFSTYWFMTTPAAFPFAIAWINALLSISVPTLLPSFVPATYDLQIQRIGAGVDYLSSWKCVYWNI